MMFGANLSGADLERANLTGAMLLDQKQLDRACGSGVCCTSGTHHNAVLRASGTKPPRISFRSMMLRHAEQTRSARTSASLRGALARAAQGAHVPQTYNEII